MGLGRGGDLWGGAGKRGFRLLPLRAGVGGGDMGVLARNSLYFSQPAHVSYRRRTAAHASYPTDSCSQRAPKPGCNIDAWEPDGFRRRAHLGAHRAEIVGRPPSRVKITVSMKGQQSLRWIRALQPQLGLMLSCRVLRSRDDTRDRVTSTNEHYCLII